MFARAEQNFYARPKLTPSSEPQNQIYIYIYEFYRGKPAPRIHFAVHCAVIACGVAFVGGWKMYQKHAYFELESPVILGKYPTDKYQVSRNCCVWWLRVSSDTKTEG